jgi:hypothetical protein
MNKRTIDPPSRRGIWRERRTVLIAAAALLLVLVVAFAGASAGIAVGRLAIESVFLLVWLAAAAGYGGVIRLLASPLRGISTVAIGLGILSILQLAVGLIGQLHRWSAFALVLVGVALLAWRCRNLRWPRVVEWLKTPADWEWLWLAAMPALAMALVAALVPPGVLWGDEPNGYDVLEYHLQLPREFYELHRIVPLHHNVFSYFPLGMEMHYLTAMQLRHAPWAGMFLAQLMNVTVTALAVVATYAVARQFANKGPAILAAVVVANVPWIGLLAPVAYNEGALILFATLAVGWGFGDSRRCWIIGGVIAGFACGVKLTAVPQVLLLVPAVATVVALARRERIANILAKAAMFLIAGVATFSPWLIRNVAWTRNPVFPEAQSLLGRAHFSETQAKRWHDAHSPTAQQRSITGRLAAARDQIAKDARYGFVLFPVGVACMIAAFRSTHAKILLALMLAWLVFWLALTHLQGRFFVTAIPLAAMGLAMMQSPRQRIFAGFAAVVVIFMGMTVSLVTFEQKVVPYCQDGSLTFSEFARIHDTDLTDLLWAKREIALVGDAKALLYPTDAGKLHYRTVFDVDVKPGQSIMDAWLEGASGSPYVVVDPMELERFSRTYYGIPPLPAEFPGPRDRKFILTPQQLAR